MSQQPLSESTPQSFRKKFAKRIPVASAVVVEELRHHGIAQLPSAIAVGLQDDTEIFETLCMVTGAGPAEPGDSKLDLTKTSKTGLIEEPCLATGTC